jgi:type I restriction enzyme S subunit
LLEELEISEVLFSDVLVDNPNFRVDAEFYKKFFLEFFRKVSNAEPLGTFVQNGYRVVYENTEIVDKKEAEEKNYPIFIQATDLKTPFIDQENLFYVHQKEWDRYPKGRIEKGELLIEVKGKVEKVSIVPENFPEKALVTGSVYKMTMTEEMDKHTVLAYLISKYGKAFKDRFKTNLLISFLSKDDLYRIPIPKFSKDFQKHVKKLFAHIFILNTQSKEAYAEAEAVLLDELGLANFTPSTEAVSIKGFAESFGFTGRLDAEYYQPKYDDYLKLIKQYQGGFKPLSEACNLKDQGYNPLEKEYYRYIELSDIGNVGEVKGCTESRGEDLPSRARRKVETGDVLVSSIEGSLGSCALVPSLFNNALCSTGFYVVASNEINPETLLVLFKSEPMQSILKQNCSGTILTAINKQEFLGILVPIIDIKPQKRIADLVKRSFALKAQSETLLAIAKRGVELAIESDEASAQAWMLEQSGSLVDV